MMIASGISPLDDRLGGLAAGHIYLLTGAPGTGKTTAALEFLNAGLNAGEKAVLLAGSDPADVVAQGQFLGIDLDRRMAADQLALLRFQVDFASRFAHGPSPDVVFDELRSLIGHARPKRVVVDSVAALLEPGAASAAGVEALAEFVESLGATTLVTYPADLAARPDRRLDPLLRRAAAVVRLARTDDDCYRMELRRPHFPAEPAAAMPFRIEPGTGIVGTEAPVASASDVEIPFVTQPTADDGRYQLLDTHAFRNAVNAHLAADRAPSFTVLTLRPRTGPSRELADLVLRSLRFDSGDLAGSVGRSVTVYLHSTQRKDATPFAKRIRSEWRGTGHGKLDVAIAAYPAEDRRVLSLLSSGPPRPPHRPERN